jgi:hypothetical protein
LRPKPYYVFGKGHKNCSAWESNALLAAEIKRKLMKMSAAALHLAALAQSAVTFPSAADNATVYTGFQH